MIRTAAGRCGLGVCLVGPAASLAGKAGDFEAAGVDSIWVAEYFQSPFVRAAVVAGATAAVTIGTHVAQAFARTPLSTALAALELQALAGGRFVLGLGSQVAAANRRWHGVTSTRPVDDFEEYLAALDAIFAARGEAVSRRSDRFPLELPPFTPATSTRPPIAVAAAGPKSAVLAARRADVVLGHLFWTVERATSVGHSDVTVARIAAPATVPGARHDAARELAHYATTRAYGAYLGTQGIAVDRDELRAALATGATDELERVAAPLLDRFYLSDRYEIDAELARADRAGLAAVVLFAPHTVGMAQRPERYEDALLALLA